MKLYNNVIKILDTSRDKKVDVLVARDMLFNGENDNAIKEAYDFIDKYYVCVTKCRRIKDNDTIKKLTELHLKGDKKSIMELCDKVNKIKE